MRDDYPYTCKETCGQEKPCGNRYCSANPKYTGPKTKPKKKPPRPDK